MRHSSHHGFVDAIHRLASVRDSFTKLADEKLILGNDNHIGDIGEYWTRRYYVRNSRDVGPPFHGMSVQLMR